MRSDKYTLINTRTLSLSPSLSLSLTHSLSLSLCLSLSLSLFSSLSDVHKHIIHTFSLSQHTHMQETKPGNGILVTINGVDVQFGGANGTSTFASKVRVCFYACKHQQVWCRWTDCRVCVRMCVMLGTFWRWKKVPSILTEYRYQAKILCASIYTCIAASLSTVLLEACSKQLTPLHAKPWCKQHRRTHTHTHLNIFSTLQYNYLPADAHTFFKLQHKCI